MMDEASQATLMEELARDWAAGGCYLTRHAAMMELNGIQDSTSIEPRHDQFLRFCEHAVVGYAGMTDRQIADAEETPALLRYLIGALANYRVLVSRSGQETTSSRRTHLAWAFGIEGEWGGGRQGRWTLARQMLAQRAYADAIHGFDPPGERGSKAARRSAVHAAYAAVFGSDSVEKPDTVTERRPKQRRANLRSLVRALDDLGYRRLSNLTRKSK